MRSPSDTDARENEIEALVRDPSYPDRARIDSDVRAFLRPASSPWIVFDRDSKAGAVPTLDAFAQSALRGGAVFASSPILRDSAASGAMFPREAAPAEPPVEPSNVVLTADVVDPSPTSRPRSTFTIPEGLVRRSPRIGIVAAAIGVVVGISALVAVRSTTPRTAAADGAVAVAAPPVVPAPSPVVAEAAKAADDAPAATPVVTKAPDEPKSKGLGKLTIKADPKTKNVWFDGKRMLGSGTRSFLVACGMHTIAVNDKKDARDVEIPCNGEYAIGK